MMKRLVCVFFALVGLGLLVAAVLVGRSTSYFIQTALRASGVVTRLNAGGSHPEVQFMTNNGQMVSYPQGGEIFGYRTGDRVTVLYDPRMPTFTACVNAPGALWDAAGGLGFLGAVFFGVGVLGASGSKAIYVRGLEE